MKSGRAILGDSPLGTKLYKLAERAGRVNDAEALRARLD